MEEIIVYVKEGREGILECKEWKGKKRFKRYSEEVRGEKGENGSKYVNGEVFIIKVKSRKDWKVFFRLGNRRDFMRIIL